MSIWYGLCDGDRAYGRDTADGIDALAVHVWRRLGGGEVGKRARSCGPSDQGPGGALYNHCEIASRLVGQCCILGNGL